MSFESEAAALENEVANQKAEDVAQKAIDANHEARIVALEAQALTQDAAIAGLEAEVVQLNAEDAALSSALDALTERVVNLEMNMNTGGGSTGGGAVETMKLIQFDNATESVKVETGTSLDDGAGALSPCTVIFGCRPNASNVDIVTNGTTLNGSGLLITTSGDKLRGFAGSGSGNQKFFTGSLTWTQGVYNWGSFVWDGSNVTLSQGGVTESGTNSTRSASPGYLDDLLLNRDDDTHDVGPVAFIRAALTQGQINALYAQIASGDLTGAAVVINAHNAASGCLIGPTADDDPTVSAGIVEWTNGRFTQTVGSPALIDIP